MADKTPEPVLRPPFARWLWDRKISTTAAAKRLLVTGEQVRRYCLEFGHPDRQIPGRDVMPRIREWTEGEITADSFYYDANAAEEPVMAAAAR